MMVTSLDEICGGVKVVRYGVRGCCEAGWVRQ